jgi:hypothetical protein
VCLVTFCNYYPPSHKPLYHSHGDTGGSCPDNQNSKVEAD